MNVLVTGFKGFLCSHLIQKLTDYNYIYYNGDIRQYKEYTDIDMILHFASPSDDSEFKNVVKTASTIICGTLNMIKLAKHNNAKLVFASTLGVTKINNPYTLSKYITEVLILKLCKKFLILRIPRVYDRSRKKGLMFKLRNGRVPLNDYSNIIEYSTLDAFLDTTCDHINNTNEIVEYLNIRMDTIMDIHTKFIKIYE